MITDNDDILIELKELFKKQSPGDFKLIFADVDLELGLEPGSCKQFITVAANAHNIEVLEVGSTRAFLRKPFPPPTRLVRS